MRGSIKKRIENPIPRVKRMDKAIAKAVEASEKHHKKRKIRVQNIEPADRTVYSEIIAGNICDRLTNGEPLKKVCATEGYPAVGTVLKWIKYPDESARPGFVERYLQARQIGFLLMGDEIIDIADDSGKDMKTITVRGRQVQVPDMEHINRDKMRIQVRQWTLEKQLPAIYGTNIHVDHTVNINLIDRMTEARARVQKLQGRLIEHVMITSGKEQSEVAEEDT